MPASAGQNGAQADGPLERMMAEALRRKTELLKQHPGRRDWNIAPEFLKNTVVDRKDIVEARGKDPGARIKTARNLTDAAKEKMASGDASGALDTLTLAVGVLMWFRRPAPNQDSEAMELVDGTADMPEKDRQVAKGALARSMCAAAACLLDLGDPDGAEYCAGRAVALRPDKVLYRVMRARTLMARGDDGAALAEALAELKVATKQDPADKDAAAAMRQALAAARSHKAKDAQLARRMMGGSEVEEARVRRSSKGGTRQSRSGASPRGSAVASKASSRSKLDLDGLPPEAVEMAQRSGIDLNDPLEVARLDRAVRTSGVDDEARGAAGGAADGELMSPAVRRWMLAAYVVIAMYFGWRMYVLLSTPLKVPAGRIPTSPGPHSEL